MKRIGRCRRAAALVFGALFVAGASLAGSYYTWVGGSGNWEDAANWSVGGVAATVKPGAEDDVTLQSPAEGAYTVTASAAIDVKSLTVGGGTGTGTATFESKTVEMHHVANDLVVNANGVMTHTKGTTYKLNLTVGGNVTIAPDGMIEANGKSSVDTGFFPRSWGVGGTYGGLGNNSTARCYGSIRKPNDLGSAGSGGSGGGAICLNVSGTCRVDGSLRAEAAGPDGGYGGGSGGSVRKLAVLSLAAATCAALNLSAFAGKECSEPSLKIADETSRQKDARLAWLESAAADAMRAAERKMSDGSVVHVPQGCCKYEAFWLRDYVMMLEGRVVPRERIVPCAKIFLKAVSPEGFGVDCVKFDGTPVYKPGYGTMGANPVLDGCPYTVKLACESWKQTGDGFFLEPVTLDLLEKVLAAIPHAPGGCLPWIDPKAEWDRCPFGFTDSVRKQGECLFSSLLELEARRNFAEMLEAAGRRSAAAAERAKVDRMVKAVESAFWDEATGLYRAATVKCREHDIWGSAYAVWLGIAAPARVRRVAEYFRDHLDGLVQKGQIRQLPPGTYWEKTLTGRDSYQNGAYWGTATGWFAWTLAKVDRAKAMSLFDDLVADYKARNANEWVFGARTDCPQYLSSLALPLQALRRMRSSRAY